MKLKTLAMLAVCTTAAAMAVTTSMTSASTSLVAAVAETGSVKGKITGVDGKPAANIVVTLLGRDQPAVRKGGPKELPMSAQTGMELQKGNSSSKKSVKTGAQGEYRFDAVPIGNYAIVVKGIPGAASASQGVLVTANKEETLDVTLTKP